MMPLASAWSQVPYLQPNCVITWSTHLCQVHAWPVPACTSCSLQNTWQLYADSAIHDLQLSLSRVCETGLSLWLHDIRYSYIYSCCIYIPFIVFLSHATIIHSCLLPVSWDFNIAWLVSSPYSNKPFKGTSALSIRDQLHSQSSIARAHSSSTCIAHNYYGESYNIA